MNDEIKIVNFVQGVTKIIQLINYNYNYKSDYGWSNKAEKNVSNKIFKIKECRNTLKIEFRPL